MGIWAPQNFALGRFRRGENPVVDAAIAFRPDRIAHAGRHDLVKVIFEQHDRLKLDEPKRLAEPQLPGLGFGDHGTIREH